MSNILELWIFSQFKQDWKPHSVDGQAAELDPQRLTGDHSRSAACSTRTTAGKLPESKRQVGSIYSIATSIRCCKGGFLYEIPYIREGDGNISTAPNLAQVWRMSRLTRNGTAEPVSRDRILKRERGQGKKHFPCSADHEQDWQPYPVDPYSAISDDHKHIHYMPPEISAGQPFHIILTAQGTILPDARTPKVQSIQRRNKHFIAPRQ